MKQSIKVYLIIFLIIALIAFALSHAFAGVAVIDNSDSAKLLAIENDGFEPHDVEEVPVIIPVVETNITYDNNTTSTIENITNEVITVADDTWNELWG